MAFAAVSFATPAPPAFTIIADPPIKGPLLGDEAPHPNGARPGPHILDSSRGGMY
ncbi:MAG: hypothetical protein M1816_001233 [Peltula sp. TS41687]|nr:MAG: hypothetical protein M1816_001233 [Peltula sp. TS41687]